MKKVAEVSKRKRGRPKGSKNKAKTGVVAAKPTKRRGRPPRTDNKVTIGEWDGKESYLFPIVQEETVKKPAMWLTVHADTFIQALSVAVEWAKEYSKQRSANYWPLVNYKATESGCQSEKRYVKRVQFSVTNFAYAESRDVGSWIPVETLEVV